MANREVVEAVLEEYGFSFHVVKLPEEVIEDKLVHASSETGLLCRLDYQNFLFAECIINVERVFRFMADSSGGDPQSQLGIRNLLEEKICEINPALDPKVIHYNSEGVLKPSCYGVGTPLTQNPDWDRVVGDINPYIIVEEIEIIDEPEDVFLGDEEEDASYGKTEVVVRRWKRLGVDIKIRKYTKDDLPVIFGKTTSFKNAIHYKVHVIRSCIVDASDLFRLIESVQINQDVSSYALADELYFFCIDVNPFLKYEEIDLKSVRGEKKRTKREKRKAKREGSKGFSEVTNEELLTLSDRMKAFVIGQDESIDRIVETIQVASCGLRPPEKPIAAYLLCGQTGIGKTLSAKILAEQLCGSRECLVRVDCSEYTQPHDIQKLLGAPPSYVGYEDGGFLTNAVQENPFCVVLFDEIEKAHSKLFDLLLQILDDARLTDGKGNVTSFKDCVVLMTSNIGVGEAEAVKRTTGFGDEALLTGERRKKALKDALKRRFRPEFLNRLDDTVTFSPLGREEATKIVSLMLHNVSDYLKDREIAIEYSDSVKTMLLDKGFSKKFGARALQRTIDREVVRPLAQMLLKGEVKDNSSIALDFVDGELTVKPLKAPSSKKAPKKAQ